MRNKKWSIVLLALSFTGLAAFAQPLMRLYGVDGTNATQGTNPFPTASYGVPLSSGTAETLTVTTAAQTVVFPAACQQITLNNTSSSETLYLQPFGGDASTSSFPISPGQAFTWTTAPGLTQISLYATGSSSIGVLAH